MGPDCFLWGSPRQNRQNPVAPEIVRSPSKATGLFFLGKYWAECEKSGRPPFGDYNIIRGDECTGRSPWRSLQHCTGAPRPNQTGPKVRFDLISSLFLDAVHAARKFHFRVRLPRAAFCGPVRPRGPGTMFCHAEIQTQPPQPSMLLDSGFWVYALFKILNA